MDPSVFHKKLESFKKNSNNVFVYQSTTFGENFGSCGRAYLSSFQLIQALSFELIQSHFELIQDHFEYIQGLLILFRVIQAHFGLFRLIQTGLNSFSIIRAYLGSFRIVQDLHLIYVHLIAFRHIQTKFTLISARPSLIKLIEVHLISIRLIQAI